MPARLLLPGLILLLAGCTATPVLPVHTTNPSSATLQGDSRRPAQAQWLRTELYFSAASSECGALARVPRQGSHPALSGRLHRIRCLRPVA